MGRNRTLWLAAAMLTAMFALASGAQAGDSRPGRVVWASSRDLVSADGHMWDYIGDLQIHNMYLETLVRDTGWNEYVPALATSWEVSPDFLTYTFKLREGVKFHSGDAFTAEDVIWSANRAKNMTQGDIRGHFTTFVEAKAIDPVTVALTFSQPNPLMLFDVAYLRIYSKAQAERDGEAFFEKFNGTGPWKYVQWNPGEFIRFARNADWWGEFAEGAPTTIEHRPIPEEATRMAALLSGEVDVVPNMPIESQQQVDASDILYTLRLPDISCIDIAMKNDTVPFNNPKLRQAMDYLIPREAIVSDLVGVGSPANIWSQSFYPWYPEELEGVIKPYDEAKAAELIKESGYKGEEIRLMTRRGRSPKDLEICELLAAMWTNAGLNVRVDVVADAAYAQRRAAGDYEMFMTAWDNNGPGFNYKEKFKAHQINRHATDPEFVRLVDEMFDEYDWDRFLKKVAAVELYLYNDPASLHIYYMENIWGVLNRVEKFETVGGKPFPLFQYSTLAPSAR